MFGDSIIWGFLGGIISIVYNGWFFVIYYAILFCVYNFWIEKNTIYTSFSNGILKYACLWILVVVVVVECFMWFCLTDSYYTRGMSPDKYEYDVLFDDKERLLYDSMLPYAQFNVFFISWIILFFVDFVATFFIVELLFFIYTTLRKNNDKISCNFHKGRAIALGIFAFITTPPLIYLASNVEALRNVGKYLFDDLLF